MIACRINFRDHFSIITTGLARNFNRRIALQKLYFSYHHHWPERSFEVHHSRCTIFYPKFSLGCSEFGAQHICIGDVILTGGKISVCRLNIKMPAFFFIQQRTKNKTAVKSREAHPFYIRFQINIGHIGAVAYKTHVVFMFWHASLDLHKFATCSTKAILVAGRGVYILRRCPGCRS